MNRSYASPETAKVIRGIYVREQGGVKLDRAVSSSSSASRSASRPSARRRSSTGSALLAYAPGSGPVCGTAASAHASASSSRSARRDERACRPGGRRRRRCVAARRPATRPAIGGAGLAPVVEHGERELEPVRGLADGDPLVARLAEDPPCALGERLAVQLARAPWASRNACSRLRPAARRSGQDAPRLRVDVQPAVAGEPAESDPAVAAELDGEARRRADRDEDRAPARQPPSGRARTRGGRSGRESIARAAGGPRGTPSRAPCPSRCGGRRPRAGRASSPSASKSPVACSPPVAAKAAWAARSRSGRSARSSADGREIALDPRRLDRDGLERALAADPARGARVEAPLHARRVEAGRVDLDGVGGQVGGRGRARRAAAPRRDRSRAQAPRRGPACASSPPPDGRRSGSRAAPRPRPGRAPTLPPGIRTTSTGAAE